MTKHNDIEDDAIDDGGDKNTITLFCQPDEMLTSQYGTTTYEEWCKLEVSRIRSVGGDAVLKRNAAGLVAVARM